MCGGPARMTLGSFVRREDDFLCERDLTLASSRRDLCSLDSIAPFGSLDQTEAVFVGGSSTSRHTS